MYFGIMYIAMELCGADYLYKRDRKRKRRYKSSPLSLCLLFLNTCRGTAAQTANMAVTSGERGQCYLFGPCESRLGKLFYFFHLQ
jgi:hypothetical protein